jgi:pimeloyl-ACP methyl ester carboxylesterase
VPTVTVNGVQLNYLQVSGGEDDEREDLVMVHGLATNLAFWYFRYAPEFSRRFRVTLLDLRGHGRSAMPSEGYSPSNLARDLEHLMDHLGIRQAHMVAHSYGGVVAMYFARAQPERVRSMVLADGHITALRHLESPREWEYGRTIQSVLDRHGLDLDTRDPYFGYQLLTRMAQWQLRGEPVPDDLAGLVMPLLGNTGRRTAMQWLRLMETTSAASEMMGDDGLTIDDLNALRFPILAIYGDNSHARLTGEKLLDVWPHAEFRRVRDAGHFFPASRPEDVIADCARFWDGGFRHHSRRRRPGENRNYFRSDRVYCSGDAWYFTTREHGRIGPFADREQACRQLATLFPAAEA